MLLTHPDPSATVFRTRAGLSALDLDPTRSSTNLLPKTIARSGLSRRIHRVEAEFGTSRHPDYLITEGEHTLVAEVAGELPGPGGPE